MSAWDSSLAIGVFVDDDPPSTGEDGGVIADRAVLEFLQRGQTDHTYRLRKLSLRDLARGELRRASLSDLDVVFSNAGPLTAVLAGRRLQMSLDFSINLFVHTTAWIGCHFVAAVINSLGLEADRRIYPSPFAMRTWEAEHPSESPIVFQPYSLPTVPRRTRRIQRGVPLTLGYLSRFTADKGADYLVELVTQMTQCGLVVQRVVAVGAIGEPELAANVGIALGRLNCDLVLVGPVSYPDAIKIMEKEFDALAFPSVSSFESAGRVVVEATVCGVPVFGSDLWLGADVESVCRVFRSTPVALNAGSGLCPEAVARLTVDPDVLSAWIDSEQAVSLEEDLASAFLADPACAPSLLSAEGPFRLEHRADGPSLRMSSNSAPCLLDIVEKYTAAVGGLPPTARLRDLSGPVKHLIDECGFRTRILLGTSN